MSKLSLRDDIEPDIGFTSLGSDIQQYSLAMPGMHAWHLKILKSVVYNDIGLLQRILPIITWAGRYYLVKGGQYISHDQGRIKELYGPRAVS